MKKLIGCRIEYGTTRETAPGLSPLGGVASIPRIQFGNMKKESGNE